MGVDPRMFDGLGDAIMTLFVLVVGGFLFTLLFLGGYLFSIPGHTMAWASGIIIITVGFLSASLRK